MNILLVGGGRMGRALAEAWQDTLPESVITIIDPGKPAFDGITVYAALNELAKDYKPDVILFAVKPQAMDDVLPDYAERFAGTPIISIAAGKTTAYLAALLPSSPIVRAMPNTPALIGRGMTGLYANADNSVKALAEKLFACVGETLWVKEEHLMDAVTALSGSGPAFVFSFTEAFIKAGEQLGLSLEDSTKLALFTVAGASALPIETNVSLSDLRHGVTSPGGTTEAGLKVLQGGDALFNLVQNTLLAAQQRSKELSE